MATPPKAKVSKGGCCGFVTSVAISAILFWLLLIRTSKPTCSIEEFDVFGLKGKTNNATHPSNTIHYLYDLKLRNKNINKGIYYDALNVTFYYNPNSNSSPIGNATFVPFYQGRRKSAHRVGNIEVREVKWGHDDAPEMFRVELATAVRYKNTFWKTKRHRLVVGANFKVNEHGNLVKRKGNKGIKLSSKARMNKTGRFQIVSMLGILIFILFW